MIYISVYFDLLDELLTKKAKNYAGKKERSFGIILSIFKFKMLADKLSKK